RDENEDEDRAEVKQAGEKDERYPTQHTPIFPRREQVEDDAKSDGLPRSAHGEAHHQQWRCDHYGNEGFAASFGDTEEPPTEDEGSNSIDEDKAAKRAREPVQRGEAWLTAKEDIVCRKMLRPLVDAQVIVPVHADVEPEPNHQPIEQRHEKQPDGRPSDAAQRQH